MRSLAWHYKLLICIFYDIFDFTVRGALIALLSSSEIVGRIFANTCLVQIASYKNGITSASTATRNATFKNSPPIR